MFCSSTPSANAIECDWVRFKYRALANHDFGVAEVGVYRRRLRGGRGSLAHLRNRFYIGEVAFKGEVQGTQRPVSNTPYRVVIRAPGLNVPLGKIAFRLNGISGLPMARGIEPGLSVATYYEARRTTFANGTHLAEVEVEADTGRVTILRYVVGHGCGRLINPMIVDGQVRGSVVHSIGNALFERMIHDEAGQPITTNYADLLPTAPEMPNIEIVHLESPLPINPMASKVLGKGHHPAAACIIWRLKMRRRLLGHVSGNLVQAT